MYGVCEYECECEWYMCVSVVYMHVCAQVCRPEEDTMYPALSLTTLYSRNDFRTWSYASDQQAQQSFCLHLSSAEFQEYKAMGIRSQTQALVPGQQVLFPIPLSTGTRLVLITAVLS